MDASYVPPPPDDLMEHLGRWEDFLPDETVPPPVQAALVHYPFEAIHPFIDGNRPRRPTAHHPYPLRAW